MKLRMILAAFAAASAIAAIAIAPASADYGPGAVYQVEITVNEGGHEGGEKRGRIRMMRVGEEVMDHECGVTATIKRGYTADAAVVSEPSAPPAPLPRHVRNEKSLVRVRRKGSPH